MTDKEKYDELLLKYEALLKIFKGLLYCQEYVLKQRIRQHLFKLSKEERQEPKKSTV